MAVPEALFRMLESPAPTRQSLSDLPNDPAVPAAEGISFAAVLQAVLPAPSAEPTLEDGKHESTGNGLPVLPGVITESTVVPIVRKSDLDLEDFAVGMGINRDLARLLLSETAPAAVDGMKTPIDRAIVDIAVGEQDTDSRGITEEEVAVPLAMIAVIPPPPNAPPPIADEDLLMWRATVSRSETPRMTGMAGMAQPLQLPVTPAMTASPAMTMTPAMTASPAMTMTSAMTVTMTPATPKLEPISVDSLPIRSSLSQLRLRTWAPDERDIFRAVVPAITPGILTERPRLDRVPPPSGIATEADFTAAGYVSETPVAETRYEAPFVERFVTAPKVERDQTSSWKDVDPSVGRDESAPRLTTSLSMSTISETSVGVDRSLATTTLLPIVGATLVEAPLARPSSTASQTAEPGRVLVMPDPTLTVDERVQAFADAVGERVLAQIRDDDWNVRLQLEPANMGTVDIDLTLRGTAVVANVSVANGEVRALLESGLPRLRDSLETAGLQLAGWTFGQSGSRPFNGSAQGWTAQAVRRQQAATGDDSVNSAPLHAIAAREPSSRAIDLFV